MLHPNHDELTRLRSRVPIRPLDPPRRIAASDGAAALYGITEAEGATYPAVTGVFYRVRIRDVGGDEEIGNTIETADAEGAFVYALHVGSAVPPEGTAVIVRPVPYRWVFRYDG